MYCTCLLFVIKLDVCFFLKWGNYIIWWTFCNLTLIILTDMQIMKVGRVFHTVVVPTELGYYCYFSTFNSWMKINNVSNRGVGTGGIYPPNILKRMKSALFIRNIIHIIFEGALSVSKSAPESLYPPTSTCFHTIAESISAQFSQKLTMAVPFFA